MRPGGNGQRRRKFRSLQITLESAAKPRSMGKPPTIETACFPSSQSLTRSRRSQPKSGCDLLVEEDAVPEPQRGLRRLDPVADRRLEGVALELDTDHEGLPALERARRLPGAEPSFERPRRSLAGRGRAAVAPAGRIGGASPQVEGHVHGSGREHALDRTCLDQPLEREHPGGVELLVPGREQHHVEIELLVVVRRRDPHGLEEAELEQDHGEGEGDARDGRQGPTAPVDHVAERQGWCSRSKPGGRHGELDLPLRQSCIPLAAEHGRRRPPLRSPRTA